MMMLISMFIHDVTILYVCLLSADFTTIIRFVKNCCQNSIIQKWQKQKMLFYKVNKMLEFRIKQTLDPFCIKCLNSKWYHRTHNMKKSYTGKIILPKCKQQQRKRYFFILIFFCLFVLVLTWHTGNQFQWP